MVSKLFKAGVVLSEAEGSLRGTAGFVPRRDVDPAQEFGDAHRHIARKLEVGGVEVGEGEAACDLAFSALGRLDVNKQFGAGGARLGSVVGVDLGRDSAKVKRTRGEATVGPGGVRDKSATLGGGYGLGRQVDCAGQL